MPRYVILRHDWPTPHFDLMLEAGDSLRTWRLSDTPRHGGTLPAEPSFDHRLIYLDYEGPVSGERGEVRRWDAGRFEWLRDEPDSVSVRLIGDRLRGILELTDRGGWVAAYSASDSSAESPTDVSDRPAM